MRDNIYFCFCFCRLFIHFLVFSSLFRFPFFFRPKGTVCRPAVDLCDKEETCTGDSAECPEDKVHTNDEKCREARGACDSAESCDGVSKACPTDKIYGPSTVCYEDSENNLTIKCTGDSYYCPNDPRYQTITVPEKKKHMNFNLPLFIVLFVLLCTLVCSLMIWFLILLPHQRFGKTEHDTETPSDNETKYTQLPPLQRYSRPPSRPSRISGRYIPLAMNQSRRQSRAAGQSAGANTSAGARPAARMGGAPQGYQPIGRNANRNGRANLPSTNPSPNVTQNSAPPRPAQRPIRNGRPLPNNGLKPTGGGRALPQLPPQQRQVRQPMYQARQQQQQQQPYQQHQQQPYQQQQQLPPPIPRRPFGVRSGRRSVTFQGGNY